MIIRRVGPEIARIAGLRDGLQQENRLLGAQYQERVNFDMRDLPPMTALIAFDAVARLGSVAAAAREIERTHGAVSKQIHKLADDLGHPLFRKQGVGLELTAVGRDLARVVQGALGDLERDWGRLKARPSNVIDIALGSTLALRWLMPRLPRFHAAHPAIDVNLRLYGQGGHWQNVDTCDVVLNMRRMSWMDREDPTYHPLGDTRWGLVCSPALTLSENVTALHRQGEEQRIRDWAKVTAVEIREDDSHSFPQIALVIEAAANAMGVAVVEKRLIADEMQDGRLIAPYGFVLGEGAFGAYVSPANTEREDVRALLDWLQYEAQQDQ